MGGTAQSIPEGRQVLPASSQTMSVPHCERHRHVGRRVAADRDSQALVGESRMLPATTTTAAVGVINASKVGGQDGVVLEAGGRERHEHQGEVRE